MASPEESGVPTRPSRQARRRSSRRPPATPVGDGAADLDRPPLNPDPPARRPPSPPGRFIATIVDFNPLAPRRSQASSSGGPSFGHTGAQRAGTRTRPPHRVPYSYWSSRQAPPGEYTREMSSEEPPVGASHPGPQRAGSRIHVRQSVLYSDRPRRSRPRRPAPAEEHLSMVSSSELGGAIIDMPRFEELSLSDPPPLNPQTADEMRDETDDDELYDVTGDEEVRPIGFGIGNRGPETLVNIACLPSPKWLGGVRGQAMLEEHGDGVNSGGLSPIVISSSRSGELPVTQSAEEKSTQDPDDDMEEQLRLLEEYLAAIPPVSMSQALYELKVAEHDVLTAQAAELGIEPPPPPRKHFLVDQSSQETSAVASHPQPSTIHRKPRLEEHGDDASSGEHSPMVTDSSISEALPVTQLTEKCIGEPDDECEASMEEIVKNAKKWMQDEVTMVFQNYVAKRDDLKIADYQVDQLCHQCVNVENYNKIFHHYNFMVKWKKANSDDDWVVDLYFAEVMQMFGKKSYFCCALESNENGLCYACQNQGVDDLKHPATGGFDMGRPEPDDNGFNFWYTDE